MGLLGVGAGAGPGAVTGSREPIPHTGLPHPD